jgi:hypothetical protein
MLNTGMLKRSRTSAGVTAGSIASFGVAAIIGFCSTVVGPAAADVTNKQSFMAAQAEATSSNVVSFTGATTVPAWKARVRPALADSAAVRSGPARAGVTADRWPGPAPAGLTADRVPHNLTADRVPHSLTADRVPHSLTADRVPHSLTADRVPAGLTADRVPHSLTASRWSGPAPDVMARPAATANEALLRPVEIAAVKAKATVATAAAPSAARAPAGGATLTAMLTPSSTMATDRSAATALLRSKAAVNALRKARHDAAAHQR